MLDQEKNKKPMQSGDAMQAVARVQASFSAGSRVPPTSLGASRTEKGRAMFFLFGTNRVSAFRSKTNREAWNNQPC